MALYKPIERKEPKSGKVYLRNGVTVAFFLPLPMDKVAISVLTTFEEYLKIIPENALRWGAVGANAGEWRRIKSTTFAQCRAQLKPEAVRARPLTAFELTDGEVGGSAPSYGITIIGHPFEPKFPHKRALVQLYFPIAVTEDAVVDDFVETVCRLAALLPYVSGYASPGLHCAGLDSRKQARAIARRYPGYDVQDNAVGRRTINFKVRGARWLTFLGPDISSKLGGLQTLQLIFKPPIQILQIGDGVLIRAGKQPELGDVSRGIGTPLLRAVAKVIEPVTAFREGALFRTDFVGQDEEILRKWERRFLD